MIKVKPKTMKGRIETWARTPIVWFDSAIQKLARKSSDVSLRSRIILKPIYVNGCCFNEITAREKREFEVSFNGEKSKLWYSKNLGRWVSDHRYGIVDSMLIQARNQFSRKLDKRQNG